MIQMINVNKSFEKEHILKDLQLNVKKGSIYGLVGLNGAGKTTIIKHLTGILRADSGEITIDGMPVYENSHLKTRIGFIPDDLGYYTTYKLKELAVFFRELYPGWNDQRFMLMLQDFGLNGGKKLSAFSKGMQKQAIFALVLSIQPDYLILDEPVDGLDPIVRKRVWKWIMDDVAERQMTVLISSHNLRELEGVCDAIGILKDGSMLIERDLDELKTDIHKIQLAYTSDITPDYSGLNLLHHSKTGSVELLIVRGRESEIRKVIESGHPAFIDMLPLSLEEIFIYELGGSENEDILF